MNNSAKNLEKAMNEYISNLRLIGSPETTISNYSARLKYFYDFYIENCSGAQDESDGAQPTAEDIRDWRDSLIESGRKKSTVKQYMRELSVFFTALSDPTLGTLRRFEYNPISPRLYPVTKADERRPYDILIPDDKLALLWSYNWDGGRRPCNWARNYAMVVTLLSTELRNGELLDLRPCDLDWEHFEIVVESGKGSKYRVVDFPLIAQMAIKLYLESGIRPESAKSTDPLFGTTAEKALCGKRVGAAEWHRGTTQWLSEVVERHVFMITGVHDIRSHDLRHIGARLDLNNGVRAESLQTKLGHSSLVTTQIYSGRLEARRGRESAMEVVRKRDEEADRLLAAWLNKRDLEANGIRCLA